VTRAFSLLNWAGKDLKSSLLAPKRDPDLCESSRIGPRRDATASLRRGRPFASVSSVFGSGLQVAGFRCRGKMAPKCALLDFLAANVFFVLHFFENPRQILPGALSPRCRSKVDIPVDAHLQFRVRDSYFLGTSTRCTSLLYVDGQGLCLCTS